jgi:hypothetical protein
MSVIVVLEESSYLRNESYKKTAASACTLQLMCLQPRRVRAVAAILHEWTERTQLHPSNIQQSFPYFIPAIPGDISAEVDVSSQ